MTWSNIDHFEGEDVILTLEKEGADTVTNYETKISSIEIGGGTESTQDVFLFGGATVNFQKPREKFNIKIDFITPDTCFSAINFGTTTTGAGAEIRSSDTSTRWRIVLWFQPSSSHLNTGTVVVPAKTGQMRRMIFCDCKSVEISTSMVADDLLKGNISFEFSATDSNGYANYFDEYVTSTTTALTILTTTAHKGILTWSATTTRSWSGSYRT